MKILITGSSGFIGYHLCNYLLSNTDCEVIGIDNMNSYYDVELKKVRLDLLQKQYHQYFFYHEDICDFTKVEKIISTHQPEIIIHLAAQAGVRYSISHPQEYITSNLNGFFNVMECARKYNVKHFLFASSSSVYGNSKAYPYQEMQQADEPVSLYAATKKSNELMAHAYHKIHGMNIIGLRFFTVYGPFGRPDMAYFSFAKKILDNQPIKVFNNGNLKRDFTYIDDVVIAIHKIIYKINTPDFLHEYQIYNIGNSKPVTIGQFIAALENALQVKAAIEYLPMQQGDVEITYADNKKLFDLIAFNPATSIEEGLIKFCDWLVKHPHFY